MYSEGSALKISPIGWKVLKGEQSVKLTRPINPEMKKKKESIDRKTISEEDVNADLFTQLKKLRSSISREENVPAYIVFSDKSLKQWRVNYP